VRVALEAAGWAVACFVVWLVTLSAITWQDAALAAGAAALSAGCAVGGRVLFEGHWHPRLTWLRWAAVLPLSVVVDTVAVLAGAYGLRRLHDDRQEQRLPAGEDDATSAARAALGALALSAAPASYVFDTDSESRALHVHSAGSLTPAWARVNPTSP